VVLTVRQGWATKTIVYTFFFTREPEEKYLEDGGFEETKKQGEVCT
jgi:hypothetical protein